MSLDNLFGAQDLLRTRQDIDETTRKQRSQAAAVASEPQEIRIKSRQISKMMRKSSGLENGRTLLRTRQATLMALGSIAALLLASMAFADYAPGQADNMLQAGSNNYNGFEAHNGLQQAGGHQQSKAKKIQIVYIKVPLTKLKPSLANEYIQQQQQGGADNSTYSGSKTDASSPASLLSSPSSSTYEKQRSPASSAQLGSGSSTGSTSTSGQYGGGSSGTLGDAGSSLGTGSSASYGASGQGQLENSSSGNAYQQSGNAYANTGPSSGFGSGTNSFGASVAFSDYPITHSATSGQQQTYAAQQHLQQSNSNNNNNYISNSLHQSSSQHLGEQADSANSYANQKLRQAKKTIIPIVVQVEHAILENNAANNNNNHNNNYNNNNSNGNSAQIQAHQQQQVRANKYNAGGAAAGSPRGHRQLGGSKRGRGFTKGGREQGPENSYRNNQNNVPYSAASNNELPLDLGASNAQYINAANAQDINQITAAINAENAASAAAALAQADAAFGSGSPAYIAGQQQQGGRNQQQHQQHQPRPMSSQYAQGLQSAASALLANTHPVIQAAASGGLASVSKLGAKLGEIIAMPSMQVPSSISSIGASLPSALSSITNQMGVQLGQAVQQVAKEHPTAHAFARQIAQNAGIQLPNFGQQPQQQQQQLQQLQHHQQQHQQLNNGNQLQHQMVNHPHQQHQMTAAASQLAQQVQLSPQAQLQNLKLSIGQNLQSAAAQLIGGNQKPISAAQSAASLLANPLAALYPQSMNMALKQLSGISSLSGMGQNQGLNFAGSAIDPHHAQSSSLIASISQQQQPNGQQQSQQNALASSMQDALSASAQLTASASEQKPTVGGKASLKSKFLSFFQPPKFISNLLSWNDRADERQDSGELRQVSKAPLESTSSSSSSSSSSPTSSLSSTTPARSSSTEAASSAGTTEAPKTSGKPADEAPRSTKPSNATVKSEPAKQDAVVAKQTISAANGNSSTLEGRQAEVNNGKQTTGAKNATNSN